MAERIIVDEEVKEDLCMVIRRYGDRAGHACLHPKEDGTCPIHLDQQIDFFRRCTGLLANGGRCYHYCNYISNYCDKHQKKVDAIQKIRIKMRLKRVGRYFIIRGTNVAISDDMHAAIGFVELQQGEFVLHKESNQEVKEVCGQYGLSFRED